MCARRFLFLIFWLTLLGVAGAFAIYQYGGSTLTRMATPKGHFAPPPPQSGPDYALASSWLAKPGNDDSPAAWVPEGVVTTKAESPAATFFIHPTTYLERDRWNAALDPGGDASYRARLFVQSQASVFNGVSDIWAPRYRQAAFGAFLLKSEDATTGARPRLSRRPRGVRRLPRRPARRAPRSSSPGTARARSTPRGC